jgi:hypothetical protein
LEGDIQLTLGSVISSFEGLAAIPRGPVVPVAAGELADGAGEQPTSEADTSAIAKATVRPLKSALGLFFTPAAFSLITCIKFL